MSFQLSQEDLARLNEQVSGDTMDVTIKARIGNELKSKLDRIKKQTGMNTSDIIRILLENAEVVEVKDTTVRAVKRG